MRLSRPIGLLSGIVGWVLLSPIDAPAKLSAASGSNVKFVALGTAGMHIEGSTPELVVSQDQDALVISVPLAKLDTGIGLRDSHMKEKYLEVGKYPTAELRVLRASLQLPALASETEGDASGTLTLHGTAKPVAFHYKAQHHVDYAVSSTMHINMNDFGIVVPAYWGIKVKPDVDIDVQFHAVDR